MDVTCFWRPGAFHSNNPGTQEGCSVLAIWSRAGPVPRRYFPGLLPRLQVPKTTPSTPTGTYAECGILHNPQQHASQGSGSISTETQIDKLTCLHYDGRSYDLNPGTSASRPSHSAIPHCPFVYTGEVSKNSIQFKNRDRSCVVQGAAFQAV